MMRRLHSYRHVNRQDELTELIRLAKRIKD